MWGSPLSGTAGSSEVAMLGMNLSVKTRENPPHQAAATRQSRKGLFRGIHAA